MKFQFKLAAKAIASSPIPADRLRHTPQMLAGVDQSWREALGECYQDLVQIQELLQNLDYLPEPELVLRVLTKPVSHYRVAIFGQDPYPTPGHATGLAFSLRPTVRKIPPTLVNIFKELVEDTGADLPANGDLSKWMDRGVALLNRTLTVSPGRSNSHEDIGWDKVTEKIAEVLGKQGAIAILWGKSAWQLEPYFNEKILSVHPSPLSAYRGFYGSKPFSRANQLLREKSLPEIDWSL